MSSVFESDIDTRSDGFKHNAAAMTKLVEELHKTLGERASEGSAKAIARHRARGQLLLSERLELLLDEDSPFLELGPLSGWGNDSTPNTCLTGIGQVAGTEVMVMGAVPTMKGGTSNEATVRRSLRAQQIAAENRLMTVSLTQSGGADLRQQEKVFHEGGRSFANQARASRAGNTTICIVFGSSTAGGAYTPGMSDYTIMVEGQAAVFLGGPPLVKMATGEEATEADLGGAVMHGVRSGVCDFLARDERHGIRLARELVWLQHRKKLTPYPPRHLVAAPEPPAYPEEELLGVFDGDIKRPFDVAEIMARVVDGSRITFFKSAYGKTLVCGFAELHGFPIGMLGNNGVLMPDATQKATQFLHRCNLEGRPVIFFQNITGFMVGTESEQQGLVKYGSLLINAISNSRVPLITMMIGASYGAGNYAMCGRSYDPRFLFSWPCSKCGVMGPDQLAGVLDIVQRRGKGKLTEADEKRLEASKKGFRKLVEKTTSVYHTSGAGLDDGVIDPRDTRNVLGFCLSVVYNAEVVSGGIYGVSRM